MRNLALGILICFGLTAANVSDAIAQPADAGLVVAQDAGPASATTDSAAPAPSSSEQTAADKLHDPAEHPAAAWDEVKAAKRTSWPLLVWTIVAMLGKALAYSRDKLKGKPFVGKLAAWLAKGKGAMILAGVTAVGAAGLAAVVDGGSWVAALVASGAAIGGALHSTTQAPKTEGN